MHIKRRTIPNFWPVQRTGTKYLAVPSHNQNEAIPLILAMRELLGLVKTKKELKKILNEKKVLVNGKIVMEVNYPISLFDSLAIPSINKYFRATLSGKRLQLETINEKDTDTSVCKVINKTILSGKKIQLNLGKGRNIIFSDKIEVGNFVIMDNKKNKIQKIIPLDKNEKVLVIKGKHTGLRGKIKEIVKEGQNEIAKVKTAGEEISTNIENLFIEL
jgi:small subunit ribosomal protein S4e